jgi:hypothetical protein
MSGVPIVSGYGRQQPRELMLNFGSIGGPATRVTVLPTQDAETQAAPPTSSEGDRLVRPKNVKDEDLPIFFLKRAEVRNRVTTCAVVCTLAIIALVFGGLGILLWRINVTVAKASETMAPRIETLMTTVDEAANNTVSTLGNIVDLSGDGSRLTELTVPMMVAAINSTQRTMERLEQILAHPQVQLALGGPSQGAAPPTTAMPTLTLG